MTILPPGVPRPRVWPRAGSPGQSTVFSRPGAASIRQAALWDAVYELAVAINEGGGGGLPPETVQAMIDQSIADLKAEPDPFPVYLTVPEGDARYMLAGTAPDLTNYYTKAEAEARFLDSAEADALFLTPAEGDARYAPVGAGGAVQSVNGKTGVVVLNAADVGALTQAQGDARYPLLTAPDPYPQYQTKAENDALYLPVSYVPPPPDLSNYYTKPQSDARYATPLTVSTAVSDHAAAADPHPVYLTAAEGDSRYTPIAGGNVTVLEEEEFAPAAAATSVTLSATPTDVLHVFRNGVEQSLAAGHYSVAGATITFSDAFAAGERVSVSYALGTSVVVDSYTKAQADALFLDQTEADALFLTQAEGDGRYPLKTAPDPYPVYATDTDLATHAAAADPHPVYLTAAEGNAAYSGISHNHDAAYVNTSGGDSMAGPLTVSSGGVAVTGASTFSVAPTVGGSALLTQTAGDARYLQPATAASTYVPLAGGSVLTGSLGPTTNNAVDLGTTALRWRKGWAVDLDLSGSAVVATALTVASKAVALSPNAGQTLQWLANGFYSDSPTKATVDALTARVATLEAQVATLQAQMGAGANGHYHNMGTWRQTQKATLPSTVLEEAPAA